MNCLRPLITHVAVLLHGARVHHGFGHVVGQPAVGGAARLGQAVREQELRILDEAREPFLLQVARREVAQQHRDFPVLHQLVGEAGIAARDLLGDHREGLHLGCPARARCRRIPPARRACGCRSRRRPRGCSAAGGPPASCPIRAASCARMNGMTTSSTKARQLSRIMRCSSERPVVISPGGTCMDRRSHRPYPSTHAGVEPTTGLFIGAGLIRREKRVRRI